MLRVRRATETVETRMAIRIMPPAMPRMPDSTLVASTLVSRMAINHMAAQCSVKFGHEDALILIMKKAKV